MEWETVLAPNFFRHTALKVKGCAMTSTKTKTPAKIKANPQDPDTQIDALRAALSGLITGWRKDQSVPPNYYRETGNGERVAFVDVHCGGYQNAHYPTIIGWDVHRAGTSEHARDVVLVDYGTATSHDERRACVAVALEEARNAADAALADFRKAKKVL